VAENSEVHTGMNLPDLAGEPLVMFDEHICRVLDISLRTLKRLRRLKILPIQELLPRLDRRHRYSRTDVAEYLARASRPLTVARRRSA
jgi:hypothetical protein